MSHLGCFSSPCFESEATPDGGEGPSFAMGRLVRWTPLWMALEKLRAFCEGMFSLCLAMKNTPQMMSKTSKRPRYANDSEGRGGRFQTKAVGSWPNIIGRQLRRAWCTPALTPEAADAGNKLGYVKRVYLGKSNVGERSEGQGEVQGANRKIPAIARSVHGVVQVLVAVESLRAGGEGGGRCTHHHAWP